MKVNPLKLAAFLTAFLSVGFLPESTFAQVFPETADAGDREAFATIVAPGTSSITGTFKPGTTGPFGANPVDVDVFAFTIAAPTSVVIEASTATLDMNLLLLREGFFGIAGDDDNGPDTDSQIAIPLAPGTYYVGVGDNNIGAYPFGALAAGDDVWDNDSDLLDAVTAAIPIAFIGNENNTPDPTNGEGYVIRFNFRTSVTGLDLAVGRNSNPRRGTNVLNASGKTQTISVRGTKEAKFVLSLANTGGARSIRAGVVGSGKRLSFKATLVGAGQKDVTRNIRTGRFRTKLTSGETQKIAITVTSDEPINNRSFLVKVKDAANRVPPDTAGAKISLRP